MTSLHAEWSLHQQDFSYVLQLADFQPDIDLFASNLNNKFPKFISWKPCVDAMHVDTFSLNWHDLNAYTFAPFSCLSSVIKKCLDDRILHMCSIFPLWKTQTWWPNLMRLCGAKFTVLPESTSRRLFLLFDKSAKHPMSNRLNLIFANLSTKFFDTTMFQTPKQPISRKMLGVHEHLKKRKQWSSSGKSSLPKLK